MSVTFHLADGERYFIPEPADELWVNLNNSNARDLLAWLDLDHLGLWDAPRVQLSDLAARCRRRLWSEPRNHDPAIAAEDTGGPGTGQARSIYAGRRPGYLRDLTKRLLQLAEHGLQKGFTHIYWG